MILGLLVMQQKLTTTESTQAESVFTSPTKYTIAILESPEIIIMMVIIITEFLSMYYEPGMWHF